MVSTINFAWLSILKTEKQLKTHINQQIKTSSKVMLIF
ncbi:hypothetical protein PPAR_b0039 [Pseudoalteromonas paragorgicola KMM 3548]|nr:hypothetical protein [Pseudoalteromonas distincta KMM 3548]